MSIEEEKLKENKNLFAVAEMDGGKILIEKLQENIKYAILNLSSEYEEMTEIQMKATVSIISANMDILKMLKGAEKNKKFFEKEVKEIIESIE